MVLSDKLNSKAKHYFDAELYKQRDIVESFFQRIKNYRHIATRYDRLATCFENFFPEANNATIPVDAQSSKLFLQQNHEQRRKSYFNAESASAAFHYVSWTQRRYY